VSCRHLMDPARATRTVLETLDHRGQPTEVHVHPPWDRPPLPGPVRPLCAGCRFGDARPNQWLRPSAGCRFAGLSPNPSRGGPPPSLQTDGPGAAIWRSRATTTPALASNRCPRSSRIRPANDRETSRNDENGWSIESAGQKPDSGINAGNEIGPENTLKVETRVKNSLGPPARLASAS
jgi:hypothetical protein